MTSKRAAARFGDPPVATFRSPLAGNEDRYAGARRWKVIRSDTGRAKSVARVLAASPERAQRRESWSKEREGLPQRSPQRRFRVGLSKVSRSWVGVADDELVAFDHYDSVRRKLGPLRYLERTAA